MRLYRPITSSRGISMLVTIGVRGDANRGPKKHNAHARGRNVWSNQLEVENYIGSSETISLYNERLLVAVRHGPHSSFMGNMCVVYSEKG